MKIKFLAFILSIVMALPMIVACADKEEAPKGNDESDKAEYEGLIINDEYTVIRGDKVDTATSKIVVNLRDRINKTASLNLGFKTDFYRNENEISDKEILVGPTNRKTEFDRTTLKAGEYYIGIEGEKIIIDAYDTETLYFAVEEFASKWLTKELGIQEDGVLLMNEEICNSLNGIKLALEDSILVLSQNIRCADDGNGNDIADRAPRFKKLVEEYKPDIIGTQETTARWNDIFKKYFGDEYGMVGCSRDGRNATSGEWNTVLYRLDRFELLDSDTFWLSNTPDVKSVVEGSKCFRICTWALLKDKKTGKTVLMCNTHLDHGADEVREKQCEILVDYLKKKIGDYPTYVTGDFNYEPNSLGYKTMIKYWLDSHDEAIVDKSSTKYTFSSYGGNPTKEIDFCFYNDKSIATSYYIATDDYGGCVSDHYGVFVKFVVK